jgi:uncharacterized protein (TIGR03083 family)
MSLDYVAILDAEAARIRAAYAANPRGRVPWSDRWSVGSVARHVASAHHVVAQIVRDRPTASFALFDTLVTPPKDDPTFPAWSAAGTEALCDALRTTDPAEPCWSVHPDDSTVGFWLRHMAHETLIHRWDAESGAGVDIAPIAPELAADGIDEYLSLYVPVARQVRSSPAGPTFRIECTDTDATWFVELGDDGASRITRTPLPTAATLSGPAEALLLVLWRRVETEATAVQLAGDPTVLTRRDELLPPA